MINFNAFDKVIIKNNRDGTFNCECSLDVADLSEDTKDTKEVNLIYPKVKLEGTATVLVSDDNTYGMYTILDKEENSIKETSDEKVNTKKQTVHKYGVYRELIFKNNPQLAPLTRNPVFLLLKEQDTLSSGVHVTYIVENSFVYESEYDIVDNLAEIKERFGYNKNDMIGYVG